MLYSPGAMRESDQMKERASRGNTGALTVAYACGVASVCCWFGCGGTDKTLILVDELQQIKPLAGEASSESQSVGGNATAGDTGAVSGESEREQSGSSSLLEAITSPEVARSLCRLLATTASANCELSMEECEREQGEASSNTSVEISAVEIVTRLPQLLAGEDCQLPAEPVDRCAAELIRYLAPYAAEVTCEDRQLQVPNFGATLLLQMPNCLGLVPGCPELVPALLNLAGSDSP